MSSIHSSIRPVKTITQYDVVQDAPPSLILLPSAALADTGSMINIPAHVRVVDNHRDGGLIVEDDEPMDDEKRMSVEIIVKVFESVAELPLLLCQRNTFRLVESLSILN